MKKKLLAMMMMLAMVLCLAACGGSGDSEPAEEAADNTAEAAEEQAEPAEEAAAPEDIIVDKEAGTVTITAQVNGTFFDQSTMKYSVCKDGGVGDKAMMAAYCDSQDFYNAMIEAGGEPWNTTSDKIKSGEFTDGQKVNITFTWDGQTEPVEMVDTLKSDNGAFDVDMRFSGNQANNAECGSGCIACLNSCWAGITSNAAYGFDAIDSGSVTAYLNDAVMPEDGTNVQATFTLVK